MKSSIKVIKQKRDHGNSEAATDNKQPADITSRKTANTIKGWIAELQERKRSQRHSLPFLTILILIAFAVTLAQAPMPATETALTPAERAIKVNIATTAGFLGPPVQRYKAGDQIPVTITMTNTSTQPLYTCISSDVYQDLPRLTRDGKLVPYMNWQSFETVYAKRNHMCEEENLPEPVLLKPNEPTVADWFLLADTGGADAWYDSLPAGKYELTIQRRLACCDGPMVESNKISFEVVP